jgi:hypothetical protein
MSKVHVHARSKSLLVSIFFCAVASLSSSTAVAVVSPTNATQKHHIANPFTSVQSDLTRRAQSDVQVRKLLNLFAAKKLNSNELYDKLKMLQKPKSK